MSRTLALNPSRKRCCMQRVAASAQFIGAVEAPPGRPPRWAFL